MIKHNKVIEEALAAQLELLTLLVMRPAAQQAKIKAFITVSTFGAGSIVYFILIFTVERSLLFVNMFLNKRIILLQ